MGQCLSYDYTWLGQNTTRGNSEGIYVNSTPENFKKHIEQALNIIDTKPQEHKILFLKSWNEWGRR